MRLLFTASSLLLVAACASGSTAGRSNAVPTQPVSAFFAGDVVVTSPDGATPYGPAKKSIVMRVVDPEHHTITEDVRQGTERFLTTLTQIEGTPRFAAVDAGKTFAGEVTFEGDPWGQAAWSYAISMIDGSGKLVGTGRLSDAGITTRKEFLDPTGQARALIVEELKLITKSEYEQLMAAAGN